jgi:hypothetical protein
MSFAVSVHPMSPPGNFFAGYIEFNWGDRTVSEVRNLCFFDPHAPIPWSCTARGSHTYSTVETGIHITAGACTSAPFNVVAGGSPPPPGGDVLSHPKLILRLVHVNVPVMGVIATFRDSNPSALVSDFTAVIDWGDGTQSDGVVSSPRPGTLEVIAGHTYATRGRMTASVSLSAPSVTESTATGTVKVRR